MVSAYPKNHYQKILRFFFTKGGFTQSKGVLSEKLNFFWHNLPKKGGFIKKNWYFFDHFSFKGHNVPRSKMCRKLGFFSTELY